MKEDTKFLWIYIAILFSFALILIIFAGLTQNNYRQELEQKQKESAGVKQSLVSLTDSNQKLKDRVTSLEKENENLILEKETIANIFDGDVEVSKILIDAYLKKQNGKNKDALDMISGISKENLTKEQEKIYNKIIGE